MKKSMIAIALLLTGVAGLQAVGDLQISLQGTNVVLSWASTNSDYYLVQYSTNLHSSHPWQTLTNWMPGSDGTNTVFVHSGAFHVPTVSPDSLGYNDLLSAQTLNQEEVPLAMRANDPDSAAPVFLYPPGFDFSGFLLYDPVTQTWRSGNGFTRDNPPNPLNPGTNTPTSIPFEMKFYKVVQHGIQCLGITNGMTLSGVVTIPIEVGIEDGELTTICVRENGVPVGESIKIKPFSSQLQIVLDTTTMSNGLHEISAFASWIPTTGSGDGGDVESIPVTVDIFNPISFPNWMDRFGEVTNRIVFSAQSAFTNIWYYIHIYDSNANYIGTLENYSSDGNIHQTWNLIGPDPEFYSYFNEPCIYSMIEIIPLMEEGLDIQFENKDVVFSSKEKQEIQLRENMHYLGPIKVTYKQTDNWTIDGMWVVANQQAWHDENDFLDIASDGFALAAETLGLVVFPIEARPFGTSFRIPCKDASESNQINAWNKVFDALTNNAFRNFFYLGHGGPNLIGTNEFCGISAEDIRVALHNYAETHLNRHTYRFVFLYGCETTSGIWPQAFGIKNRENIDIMDYIDSGTRPSVFIGFSNKNSVAIGNDVLYVNSRFLQLFLENWIEDIYGVKEALDVAARHPDVRGYIPINKIKVFGYWYQGFSTFNR